MCKNSTKYFGGTNTICTLMLLRPPFVGSFEKQIQIGGKAWPNNY